MKYLADLELQLECIASEILKGRQYPIEYINICTYFPKIELVDISNEISMILIQLQKKVTSSEYKLKDIQMENFFYGENEEVFDLLLILKNQIDIWIPIYKQAFIEKGDSIIFDLESKMQGQDFVGMGEAINSIQPRNQELTDIRVTETQLLKLKGVVDYLIPLYGTAIRKLSKKEYAKPKTDTQYNLYIQSLITNIDKVAGNAEVAFVLGRSLKSLMSAFPKTEILDPYTIQITDNLIKILTNPEQYYKFCKTDDILSDNIGHVFQYCYPAYYDRYFNMCLDDYPKMDYDEQIVFRKCFAIPADNSKLLSFTNTYIALGYT